MNIACIDMEGVLIPELWPHIATATGIPELATTTREQPNYFLLVEHRIRILKKNFLRLCDVQALISDMTPLPGALEFLVALGVHCRIVLVSDAFEEMIRPLWQQLGEPELRCHHFSCNAEGYVCAAHYTRQYGKHEVIDEFSRQGFATLAVGDAFNDLSMLRQADTGFLFRPSAQTLAASEGLCVVNRYRDILSMVAKRESAH